MYLKEHHNEDKGTFWYTQVGDNHEVMNTSQPYPDAAVLRDACRGVVDNIAKCAGDRTAEIKVVTVSGHDELLVADRRARDFKVHVRARYVGGVHTTVDLVRNDGHIMPGVRSAEALDDKWVRVLRDERFPLAVTIVPDNEKMPSEEDKAQE